MNTTMNNTSDHGLVETLYQLNDRYSHTFNPFVGCLVAMATIGIVGNVIVVYVFAVSLEYKNSNFKTFVISLAFIDLLCCVIVMPAEIAKTWNYFSFPNSTPCKLKCFFNVFLTTAAAMSLLTICIDRFRKVCQPLKKQIYPGMALKMVVVAMAFSFVVSLPAPIMCGISTANKTNIYNTTTTVYLCTAEKRYQKSIVRVIYKACLTVLLFVISIALIIMYAFICRIVIRQWKVKEKKLGSFSSEISDTTKATVERSTDIGLDTIDNSNDKDVIQNAKQAPRVTMSRQESIVSTNSSSKSTTYTFVKRKASLSASQTRFRRRKSSFSPRGVPYKTLIWLILTVIFVVTYFLSATLAFFAPKQYLMSPAQLLRYTFLYRFYFINNIINPIIYAWLDRRFKSSIKEIISKIKVCRT